ncbi:aminotransferase DegT [Planctomycetota bacterium]|nr:aminotransferase DegT [Planctomycetota bacterium]
MTRVLIAHDRLDDWTAADLASATELRIYASAAALAGFLSRDPTGAARLLARVQVVPVRRRDLDMAAKDLHPQAALDRAAADRVQADVILSDDPALFTDPRRCSRFDQLPPAPQRPIAFNDLAAQQADLLENVDDRIERVLRHGQYIMGPEVAELEDRLRTMVGRRHAIGVSSGTHALEIVLRALGVGPGDQVITTPFTWIATAEVIPLVGATPVFVDIRADTFCLDEAKLAAAITPRTKAIIPVSLYGQLPAMERISEIAGAIPVIEDAAQSLGATRHGRPSGAWGVAGCTSFFPSKPLGGYGDGGAILCDDDELARRCRAIRTHGGERRHHHDLVGLNGRLDTLQAAILLAKLDRFADDLAGRQAAATAYDRLLTGQRIPLVDPGNSHAWAQYTIRSGSRDALAARLAGQGIPAAIFYPRCLHQQPVFAPLGYSEGSFPIAEAAAREVLSLPMHGRLLTSDQYRIVNQMSTSLPGKTL